MSVYVGRKKVGFTVNRGVKCMTGTATSDSNGVITFPKLDFTPTKILVWNIKRIDHKELAEEDGEEWDDTYIQYTYDGIMLFAIYKDGKWISQGLGDNSGDVYITNASAEGGTGEFAEDGESSSGISVNGNVYSYQLDRYRYDAPVAHKVFDYAIYG